MGWAKDTGGSPAGQTGAAGAGGNRCAWAYMGSDRHRLWGVQEFSLSKLP